MMHHSKHYRLSKRYLVGGHRSPIFTAPPASLRLAPWFFATNHARGGLWGKWHENTFRTKVTRSTFRTGTP